MKLKLSDKKFLDKKGKNKFEVKNSNNIYHPFKTIFNTPPYLEFNNLVNQFGFTTPFFNKNNHNRVNPNITNYCMTTIGTNDTFSSGNYTTRTLFESNNYEEEIRKLRQVYHDEGSMIYDPALKKEVMSKYHLQNKISPEEIYSLKGLRSKNQQQNMRMYLTADGNDIYDTTQNNSLSKVNINIPDYEFLNPLKALKKLKLNKQIAQKMMGIFSTKQVQMYQDSLEQVLAKNISMPSKVTIHKLQVRSEDDNIEEKPDDIDIVSKSYKTEGMKKLSRKNFSRDDMLSLVDYHGSYGGFSKTRPVSRSQATITQIGSSQAFLLVGGMNSDRMIDFWICEDKKYTWKSIIPGGDKVLPRMGHTTVYWKNKMYIYGGNTAINPDMPREDIMIFSLDSNMITIEKCSNKKEIKWRRNHIAESIGRHMIIHGGISELGDYLCDFWMLDLHAFVWTRLEPVLINNRPVPVAFHSSALVLTSEKRYHSHLSIYKSPSIHMNMPNNLKHEGIYIFGGINKDGVCNNDMRILKVGQWPLDLIMPELVGIGPCPRHSASMNYYEDLEVLIIYGGKTHNEGFVYNDIYLLNLYNLTWIKANVFENIPKKRAEHGAAIMFNKLVIFGGSNSEGYVGSDLYMISLDYFFNRKKKAEYNALMKYHAEMRKVLEERTENESDLRKGEKKSSTIREARKKRTKKQLSPLKMKVSNIKAENEGDINNLQEHNRVGSLCD